MISGLLMPALMVSAVCWPLFAAFAIVCCFVAMRGADFIRLWRRPWLAALWMSAPVPALAVAFLGEAEISIFWFMMGGIWQTEGIRGPILGFTAALWLFSGIYAHGYLGQKAIENRQKGMDAGCRLLRFVVFWQLSMSGNLLLVIAADIPGFYAGFTLMTFSAYGLVIHEKTGDARRGAAAYIIMAVIGEGLIIGGLLWGAGIVETIMLSELQQGLAASPQVLPVSTLLWLGFGVKAGVAGIHMWLPMAHPVAPVPASAILSGAMIKAGLWGWFFTLPVGMAPLSSLGYVAMAAGMAGVFGAALYGVFHRDPKVVLAYSSISQMGMMTSLFGLALAQPALWPVTGPVLVLFALHHGLNKGALFLATGMTRRRMRMPGILFWIATAFPAISLAGVAGSGLAVKWAVKLSLYENNQSVVALILSMAAVGTIFLMVRFLLLQYRARQSAHDRKASKMPFSMIISWFACVIAAIASPWWLYMPESLSSVPPVGELPGLLWPVAAGAGISALGLWVTRSVPAAGKLAQRTGRLPAGDLWPAYAFIIEANRMYFEGVATVFIRAIHQMEKQAEKWAHCFRNINDHLGRMEPFFRVWAGVLMAIVAMVMAFSFFFHA